MSHVTCTTPFAAFPQPCDDLNLEMIPFAGEHRV